MKRRLQEDGVDPAASDEEKLRHVWQLYSNTEVRTFILFTSPYQKYTHSLY